MIDFRRPIYLGGAFLALFLGSFSDETAQIIFALRLAEPASVATLFSAGLGGGMLASGLAPKLLRRFSANSAIAMTLVFQSVLIGMASLTNDFYAYVGIAIALGGAGSIFWTSIMVAVPGIAQNDTQIEQMSRTVEVVRNLGYVAGPLAGGALYTISSAQEALALLAFMGMIVAIVYSKCSRSLHSSPARSPETARKNRSRLDIQGFFRTKGVIRAICPLIITVMATSTLNVLLLVRVRTDLNYGAQTYGAIVGALSFGLVVAPFTMARLFKSIGDSTGASAAASLIGVGICLFASTEMILNMALAAFLIGIANGTQNTLIANFMKKTIDESDRTNQMPVYLLVIQVSVSIGFASAGVMQNTHQASGYLLAIGVFTTISGAIGVILNLTRYAAPEKKGL